MIRNHPGAYGFLAALLVLLFAALVNTGCARAARAEDDHANTPTRSLQDRVLSAILIRSECGSGSGVMMDSVVAFTAEHVTMCNGKPAKNLLVVAQDGLVRGATVEVVDDKRDLARIRLNVPVADISPVMIRSVVMGERLCEYSTVPEPSTHCGTATPHPKREEGDIIVQKMNTWYGNSGSGVYSNDGMLIGITVRLEWCDSLDALLGAAGIRVDTCGGFVSSLEGPVLL